MPRANQCRSLEMSTLWLWAIFIRSETSLYSILDWCSTYAYNRGGYLRDSWNGIPKVVGAKGSETYPYELRSEQKGTNHLKDFNTASAKSIKNSLRSDSNLTANPCKCCCSNGCLCENSSYDSCIISRASAWPTAFLSCRVNFPRLQIPPRTRLDSLVLPSFQALVWQGLERPSW